jgi:hypothetical protein
MEQLKARTKESDFWKSMACTVNPGWKIERAEEFGDEPVGFEEQSVRIYIVDTRTGWRAAGSCTISAASLLTSSRSSRGRCVEDWKSDAEYAVQEVSKLPAEHDHIRIRQAISAAWVSLTFTQTYALVVRQQAGSPAGHWIFILYQCNDRSLVSRPFFIRDSRTRAGMFLPTGQLQEMIQKAVAADVYGSNSVSATIRRSGGVELAAEFRQ